MSYKDKSASLAIIQTQNNKEVLVSLEVTTTNAEIAQGLMHRLYLKENEGMLFMVNPLQIVNFWMKDTLISLDIIFINNGRIVNVIKNTIPNQSHTIYSSVFPITEAIEVKAGFLDKNIVGIGNNVLFKGIAIS